MRSILLLLVLTAAVLCVPASVRAGSFTDVSAGSSLGIALERLSAMGAVSKSGAFRPGEKITRAQAIKMLIAPIVKKEELAKITTASFSDVPEGAWYLPYAEAARMRKIVSPSGPFNPDGSVTKAAFLKMLFAANKTDPLSAFSDIRLPLSSDIRNSDDWYYAPLRYAVASSVTAASQDGLLSPSREITRADAALLLYRFDRFVAGERTQALLTQTESEIGRILTFLDAGNIREAEYASVRSMLTSRGALTSRPNEPLTQGAVKIAKGFYSLVLAYKAGRDGVASDVIRYAKEAYAAADKAEAITASLSGVAKRMRTIAKNIADEARKTETKN